MLRSGFLQGIILFVVPGKIQRFRLRWDPFAGIVSKPPAFILYSFIAFFGAQNLSIFQIRTMQTVAAGTFYLFTKQHGYASGVCFDLLYRK